MKYDDLVEELSNKTDNCFYLITKRCFDVFTSFIALLILSFLLLIIALIILCSQHHNPIFRDKRVGKNGKIIRVFKFKTMYQDAESNPEKYLNPEQMQQWKTERKVDNDPRETKIGKFLRKTSIDELPQLLNVVIGDLALVGNRPITEEEMLANFSEKEIKVLNQRRPGITGTWQVYHRTKATWKSGERKEYIFEYLKNRSLWYDLKLLILTIPSCIKFALKK